MPELGVPAAGPFIGDERVVAPQRVPGRVDDRASASAGVAAVGVGRLDHGGDLAIARGVTASISAPRVGKWT